MARPASRILIVTSRLPWPPRRGADLRLAAAVDALAALGHELGVIGLRPRPAGSAPPAGVQTWVSNGPPGEEKLAAALDWIRAADGSPNDRWWTPLVEALVEQATAGFEPDVLVVDQLWGHRALALDSVRTRTTVFCSHNVEAAIYEELARSDERRAPPVLAGLIARRVDALERAVVESVDQIWACSANDAALFATRYERCAPVRVVPNTLALEPPAPNRPDLEQPLLLYVGPLGYQPNTNAALWLAQELLPALRAAGIPARLRIIGAQAPPALLRLAGQPGIEVLGFVDDLQPHLQQAAVIAVPLRAGGGTRFKILEAFAAGVPVVSTAKGVEGLDVAAEEDYLEAETTAQFVAAVRRLCAEGQERARLVHNARALVERSYSAAALREALSAALAELPTTAARG